MNEATNASVGRSTSSGASRAGELAVDEHAHLVGEGGCVLVVVGDEDRRQGERAAAARELGADGVLGVRVERGERLVEEDHARAACERAGKRDSLALTAGQRVRPRVGEVGDTKPLEVLVDALLAGIGDVLADGHVREERVLLEDEPDAALVRLAGRRARAVEPDVVAERDRAPRRPDEPGDRSEHRRLAGAGGTDEGDGVADVER